MKIHITKQGESIDTIANNYSVSRQDLTGINPHVNLASDLVPGLKLKIPAENRTVKNENIEQFFPNLEAETAKPIGLKPFETEGAPTKEMPVHNYEKPENHFGQPLVDAVPYGPEANSPWNHLANNQTHLTQPGPQHSWNPPYTGFMPQQPGQDTRAIIPPMPYYPPYPYPNPYYGYPPYGYGVPLPIPVPGFGYGGFGPGFGPGFGYGGFGGGFHGGHGGGHRFEYSGDQTTTT